MLAEMIQTLIRQQDLDLLPDGAIDRAIVAALEQYSKDFPNEKLVDVNATGELLNMPPDWVNRFSNIVQIEHPADGSLIPTVQPTEPGVVVNNDDGSVSVGFTLNNWVLLNGAYYIDMQHGLETLSIEVDAFDEFQELTEFGRVEPLNSNKVRVWVGMLPDARFKGSAVIQKV